MEKLLLITATCTITFITTMSAQQCTAETASICNDEADTRYCDIIINRCSKCEETCGAAAFMDTDTCHKGCSTLCLRLKNSATADDHDRYPKCWKNLPPTAPAISTRKPSTTTKEPQGCLHNPEVCKRKQFCNETANSCSSCALPCGQRGSFQSCQNLCPKWCDHVLSLPRRKYFRESYPFCQPATTATTPKPPSSSSLTPATVEPSVPEKRQTNEPRRTTRIPTNQKQEDSGPMMVYALAAAFGLLSIVCVGQFVIIVRRRRTV